MPTSLSRNSLAALALVAALWAPSVQAEDATFELTIRDHRFQPETLDVPANKRIKLIIENADPTPEEFESYELNREKVIPGNSKAIVYIGPLDAGTYPFVGEFNQKTAKGSIVAK
tara:strand:+ start:1112 stop:1456 length:345 start_codon:yes stop_codon:yes gene_type:complete